MREAELRMGPYVGSDHRTPRGRAHPGMLHAGVSLVR